LKTPRIAAVIDIETRTELLPIVRSDALLVRAFTPKPGEAFYVATYEHDYPDDKFRDDSFHVTNAAEACYYVLGKGGVWQSGTARLRRLRD
jgi:IMP cyclohydrolase